MRFHKKRLVACLICMGICYIILINSSTKLALTKTKETESESTVPWHKKLERFASKYHEHRYDPSKLYSNPDDPYHDRILEQMHFAPKNYDPYSSPEKVIYMFDGLGDLPVGRTKFQSDKCPVNKCILTDDNIKMNTADAIFFKDSYAADFVKNRDPNQIWILYMLESPFHTSELNSFGSHINWTATYRWDSTITAPYERFTLFKNMTRRKRNIKNYAKGKTKKVAWFVSNCGAMNQRLEYAKELAKYIQVYISKLLFPFEAIKLKIPLLML